jgi:pyruvate dehydrogenase (quinone)
MSRKVADLLWEMLANAGVKRCYGIVGDALNPVIDGLRRNGKIEFIHVRHEEYGVFAAVAEAYLTGNPVAVCGTAGPGVVHLFNGLMDARKEGAPIIAIAGDVETELIDTAALEELNPYKFFEAASLYTGRLVNPKQARAIINTAILTALLEKGPTVISIPGDVASADAADQSPEIRVPVTPLVRPSDADLNQLVKMINDAKTVAIFGGDGCRDARDEVVQLANRLKAPVGYSFRGKQWLEHDNPNAVGLTGLLGYGGAYGAIHDAELLLLLGTDFPFSEFLPGSSVKKVQIDKNPKHIGRRTAVDLGLVGDIKATVAVLAQKRERQDRCPLSRRAPCEHEIVPRAAAALRGERSRDQAHTSGIPGRDTERTCRRRRHVFRRHGHGLHLDGETRQWRKKSPLFGSFSRASMANAAANAFGAQLAYPGRQTIAMCGDGGFTMLGLGDLQVERKTPVVQIILNNGSLDFVNIEQEEAGIIPFGVEFKNPNFAKVAEAMGAKGIRIEEPGDVREGLAAALAHKGGPVVVDAVVDPFALSLPSHVPFHTATGYTLSLAKQVWSGKMDAVIKTIERNVRLI